MSKIVSAIVDPVASLFASKPVTAETTIMGIPAWTIITGIISYMIWNKASYDKLKEKYKNVHERVKELENKRERNELDLLRKENMELRKRLESLLEPS
jgi:uncharacterized membrane protein (DUF106 family)